MGVKTVQHGQITCPVMVMVVIRRWGVGVSGRGLNREYSSNTFR